MLVKIRKKQILLPETKIFEGDKRADTLVFSAERYFGDVDLSGMVAYLKVSAPFCCDKFLLESSCCADVIEAVWVIPPEVTAKEGEIRLQLVFESENGETVVNTNTVCLRVEGSIDIDGEVSEYVPSLIGSLQNKQEQLASELKDLSALNALKADKTYVDGELALKADADSVPVSLSELENDAGYLTQTDLLSITEDEIDELFVAIN